jgi:hypothetical protein
MGLRQGERTLGAWVAGYVPSEGSFDDEATYAPVIPGVLVLTDQRLAFVQEKGVLKKQYQHVESVELGRIEGHRITSLLKVKELEVEILDPKGRRNQRFSSIYEIDPLTLKALRPSTPDEARAFFEGALKARR